jgi:hypothetical protein
MPADLARVRAVLAALKKVRERAESDGEDEYDTSLFNRWIDMLNGAVDADCSVLRLAGETASSGDFLMTAVAAIAFLEALASEQA